MAFNKSASLFYEDVNGYLSVNYIDIIPLLIESMKDLMQQNKYPMNLKYISIIILTLSMSFCTVSSQDNNKKISDQSRSKQLIKRYNKLRSSRSLPKIKRDSIIDDVTNEILLDKKYRKSNNEFNEDSIRSLFYNRGVIDYKYEIKEILDKDTNTVFNSFLLTDRSPNIRMGYSKQGNKNLLIKTKSYLKYDFGGVYCPRIDLPYSKNVMKSATVKADSVVSYVKWMIPGKYYYQYSNHIPLSSESIGSDTKYEVKKSVKKNPFTKGFDDIYHNLVLTSIHPDMYLIVTNEKNEIVAILK